MSWQLPIITDGPYSAARINKVFVNNLNDYSVIINLANGPDTDQLVNLNNTILDYCAGWVMTFTFEVAGFNVCDIPKP